MNKYRHHIFVIPEDDANRQIVDGFVLNCLHSSRIQVMPVAGGWRHVRKIFEDEYIHLLRNFNLAHVVMVIDFDNQPDRYKNEFDDVIPDDIKSRVFVVGLKDEPEPFRTSLGVGYEQIGSDLAKECSSGTTKHWDHEQLKHNDPELKRLIMSVKPFLFQ